MTIKKQLCSRINGRDYIQNTVVISPSLWYNLNGDRRNFISLRHAENFAPDEGAVQEVNEYGFGKNIEP